MGLKLKSRWNEGQILPHPFNEKLYVMELIRFLLFSLQTSTSHVHTSTGDVGLTVLDKRMLAYLR